MQNYIYHFKFILICGTYYWIDRIFRYWKLVHKFQLGAVIIISKLFFLQDIQNCKCNLTSGKKQTVKPAQPRYENRFRQKKSLHFSLDKIKKGCVSRWLFWDLDVAVFSVYFIFVTFLSCIIASTLILVSFFFQMLKRTKNYVITIF